MQTAQVSVSVCSDISMLTQNTDAAGGAGSSFSGFAFGGNGQGHGPGGNAYTGATGASRGGNVINSSEGGNGANGNDIDNTTASKYFMRSDL